jgi:hypothetical protein
MGLNALVQSLNLDDPTHLTPRIDGSDCHPHLALQKGAACRHCKFRSTSIELLSRHLKKLHQQEIRRTSISKGSWQRDHISTQLTFQSWVANDIHNAWQVNVSNEDSIRGGITLAPLQAPADHMQRHAEELRAKEKQHLDHQLQTIQRSRYRVPEPAMMTNWIRRTGWEEMLRNARRDFLITLAELPAPRENSYILTIHNGEPIVSSREDKRQLVNIMAAINRLFDRCNNTVRHTDNSLRRWIRGRFPDLPYKAPFELVTTSSSEQKYRRQIKRCVCFWLRFWKLPSAIVRWKPNLRHGGRPRKVG